MMDRELYFCSGFETAHLNTSQRDLNPHRGDLTPATGAAAGEHRVDGGQHVGRHGT